MTSIDNQDRNIIFISQLPDRTSEEDLETFFYKYKSHIYMIKVDSNLKNYDVFNSRKAKATIVFKTHEKAEEARNELNMTRFKGKIMNLMWLERDNTIRYNNKANLFVKGIPHWGEPRDIYELFAKYGEIISSKILEGEQGYLIGYGYINYYNVESAEEAIKNLNGYKIMDSQLEVMPFQKKNERLQPPIENSSIYIKNIPHPYLKKPELNKLFAKYGTITFTKLFENKGKYFAIMGFTTAESANKAKEEMNNKKLDEKDELSLYVDLLQKKSERKRMLLTKIIEENSKLDPGVKNSNLYIKNLPLNLTDEKMKEIFSTIGEVKSAKISRYLVHKKQNNEDKDVYFSNGFGYVCFKNEQDAKKAMETFHEKKLPGYEEAPRPVLISVFMPKYERGIYLTRLNSYPGFLPVTMEALSLPYFRQKYRPRTNIYYTNNNNNYRKPLYAQEYSQLFYPKQNSNKIVDPNNQRKNETVITFNTLGQENEINTINESKNESNNDIINESNNSNNSNNNNEINYIHLKSLQSEEEQKDYLGEYLFKKIEQHPLAQSKNFDVETISRITGMILGIGDIEEIFIITTNNDSLTNRIQEAIELLKI